MRFSILSILILIGVQPILLAQSIERNNHIILASGSKDGAYFKAANEITNILNANFNQTEVIPIISQGSNYNVEALKESFADIIIAQRDVLVDVYYNDSSPLKDLEVILPLFPEALQIIGNTGRPGVISTEEFKKKVKDGQIETFAIGPPGSTTNQTTKKVLQLLGFSNLNISFDESNYSDALKRFLNCDVQVIAFLSAIPIDKISGPDNLSILSFSPDESSILRSHLTNMDIVSFGPNTYPFVNKPVTTIGTWALLASTGENLDQLALYEPYFISHILSSRIKTGYINSHIKTAYNNPNLLVLNSNDNYDQISLNSSIELFFRGLPPSKGLDSLLGYDFPYRYIIIPLVILLIIALIGWQIKSIRYNALSLIRLWFRYKHIAFAIAVMVMLFFGIAKIIWFAELNFYKTYLVRSKILDMSSFEFHKWVFLNTLLSDFSFNYVPYSLLGQIFSSITPIVFIGSSAYAGIGEMYYRQTQKSRKMGLKKIKLQNHYVICGWNHRTPLLVKKINKALKNYNHQLDTKIVLVNEKIADELHLDETLRDLHDIKAIEYIKGKSSDTKILTKACIDKAKTVILLAEDNTSRSDEKNLLRALAISQYCQRVSKQVIDNIYIIAEVNNNDLTGSFTEAGVNEIVCTADYGDDILIQSSINHGISNVLSEVLTYNDQNEFYTIDIKDYPNLENYTFDQLLPELRKQNILLLGIKSVWRDNNNKIIIDRNSISNKMQQDKHISRQIMINPLNDSERDYIIDDDDHLIVLAKNKAALKKAHHIPNRNRDDNNTHLTTWKKLTTFVTSKINFA